MPIWFFISFLLLLAMLLALDMGLLSRRPKDVSAFEARASVALWLLGAAGVGFLLALAHRFEWMGYGRGPEYGPWDTLAQFGAVYVAELALSLDNIVVVSLIFAHFAVEPEFRNRVLFWTMLTCLIVRSGILVAGGWIVGQPGLNWALAVVLIVAAIRTIALPDDESNFDKKLLVRLARGIPVGASSQTHALLVRTEGKWKATPLLAVALATAAADMSFAIDSMPAVYSITRDPVVALTGSALAILSLRSLFFALHQVIGRFRYMRIALAVVLVGLTAKLVLGSRDMTETLWTLGSVAGLTIVAVLASHWRARGLRRGMKPRPTPIEDLAEAAADTRKNLRKVLILMAGTFVLLVAILVGLLPGPGGLLIAPIGIAILATEFAWARMLMNRLQQMQMAVEKHADKLARRTGIIGLAVATLVYTVGVWAVAARAFPGHALMVWAISLGGYAALGYMAWRLVRTGRKQSEGPQAELKVRSSAESRSEPRTPAA